MANAPEDDLPSADTSPWVQQTERLRTESHGGVDDTHRSLYGSDALDEEIHMDSPFVSQALDYQSVPAQNAADLPLPIASGERRRLLLRSALKLLLLLGGSIVMLVLTLWIALPLIEPKDRAALRLPRSFEQLQKLERVLQRYSHEHVARVMFSWVTIMLFLQTYCVPGSMYMSMLAGAFWGLKVALPLACLTIATGSTLCYFVSACASDSIRAMPKWHLRVQAWQDAVAQHRHNLLSYLILLRLMPVPPDFVINIIAPHLGVSVVPFWISCVVGVSAETLIHTAIGEELDQMTGSKDFHLFTWRNMLLLGLVGVAALVPVAIKRMFPQEADIPPDPTAEGAIRLPDDPPAPRDSWLDRARDQTSSLIAMIYPPWATRARELRSARERELLDPDAEDSAEDDEAAQDDAVAAWRSESLSDWFRSKRPLAAMPPPDLSPPGESDDVLVNEGELDDEENYRLSTRSSIFEDRPSYANANERQSVAARVGSGLQRLGERVWARS